MIVLPALSTICSLLVEVPYAGFGYVIIFAEACANIESSWNIIPPVYKTSPGVVNTSLTILPPF